MKSWLVGAVVLVSCSEHICPTIACTPQISIAYAAKVPSQYSLSASLGGMTFFSDCPKAPAQYGPPVGVLGIASCDQNGFVLAGVDLGHGDNSAVELTVTVNNGSAIAVQATLRSISNSRDCDIVCFQHAGTLAN